jgi:hypothetical protein
MNRAHLAAVVAAGQDLASAAAGLLQAHAHRQGLESLRLRMIPEAWPPVGEQADRRVREAQWRYDNAAAAVRRLTTKEAA